jgi:NAD(P)-dependent dehydrogenase (short-subunit alcohol dehydrogenase family)
MESSSKKWILVTGASSGIGKATVEFLAKKGFGVYAGVRSSKAFDEYKTHSYAGSILPVVLDVTKPEQVNAAIKEIETQGTGLYGLVNNAGIAKAGPLVEIDDATMQTQFDVNFFGLHRVTRACFPFLRQSKGRIVMMSSDSGFFATPFFGPYCASKFAVEGYADSLRRELAMLGIQVILIEPGRITTPIWDKGEQDLAIWELNKSTIQFQALELVELARKVGAYSIMRGKTVGLDPIHVAHAVYTALNHPKPKLRYLVAKNTAEYRLIKLLPGTSVDKMVAKKMEKIHKLSL